MVYENESDVLVNLFVFSMLCDVFSGPLCSI